MTTPSIEQVPDVVGRLRACANGIGSFKSDKGDYGLCDDSADLLEFLAAELTSPTKHR